MNKATKYILLVLTISWVIGFFAFHLIEEKYQLAKTITTIVYSFTPAILAFLFNKQEKGNWQSLKFIKPSAKKLIIGFLIPLLYFVIIISCEVLLEIRTTPDWSQIGNVTKMIIGYPIMVLLVLGEEIGWRGYLQNKLIESRGAFKGILLLGFIWGIWHFPLALSGYNFPNHPYLEAFVINIFIGIALAFVIAYLGFKTYSIWIGVLLHASNNYISVHLLRLTKIHDEFLHALTYIVLSLIFIVIFGWLYHKKINNEI